MRRIIFKILRASELAVVMLCLAVAASAQFKASVQGTVADAGGGILVNAKVTLTNNETGKTQTAQSNGEGFYRISGLAPGRYTLTAEQAGFKKQVFDNVTVSAESAEGVNFALEAGDITATVTVNADDSPALRTEDANTDRSLTTAEILRLPQVGRDPYELARLAPGVFGNGARSGSGGSVGLPNTTGPGGSNNSIFATENQIPISANGQRVSANSIQVDGVSVNSQTWGGAAVITPSQEAVKEVSVTSSSFSAEDGRNSGASIKVVTQNGTNSLHGSAFFKYNEPGLNARNKFDGQRVENKFRTFGGSLGGPIVKNRLFFFFAYEGLKNNTNNTYTAWTETNEYRQLIRAARPNGISSRILGQAGAEPRIVGVIPTTCAIFGNNANECRVVNGRLDIGSPSLGQGRYVPFSAFTGGGFDGIADVQFARLTAPGEFRGHQFISRVDYNISSRDELTVTTNFTPSRNLGTDQAAQSRPMADIRSERLNWAATGVYRRAVSATIYNEARFNITRWGFDELAANPDANFGLPRLEVEGLPFDRLRFGVNRSEGTPGIFSETALDFRDTLTKITGNHALKFGVEYRRDLNSNSLIGGARPLYSFVRQWNLANDTPIFEAVNLDPNNGKPAEGKRDYRGNNYAFFAQDDWKFRPNLTFNIGLRYEFFGPLNDTSGQQSNLIFGSNGLANATIQVVDKLHKADRNNFGPQLGFAWSPEKFKSKAVLRGGFGIGYNRLPNALFLNTRGNPPFFARFNICCGTAGPAGGDGFGTPFVDGQILYATGSSNSPLSYPANPVLGTGINPATGAPRVGQVEIYGSGQDQPNAYIYRYSLEGQYELPAKMTATLGYQGSSTHKLVRIVNQRYLYPVPGDFYAFAVFFAQPDVNANFNAMNASLNRRFSQGVQFTGNYRWSKSIDTLSYEGPGFVTNQTYPQDQRTERGPSDYDVKHNFNLTALWDLPFFRTRTDLAGKLLGGWQVNTIITANSGFPWTPLIGNCTRSATGDNVCPSRPIGYLGGNGTSGSNEAFLSGSNFTGGGARYFNTNESLNARPGIGRNVFRGPRYTAVDLSLTKKFGLPTALRLGEGAGFEIRANFFNLFNQLNLAPFGFFSSSTDIRNPNFGKATAGLSGRVIEFQARFSF